MGVDPGRLRREAPGTRPPAEDGQHDNRGRGWARALASRVLLWALPVGAALAALLLVGRARREADLATAADLLAQGRAGEARPLIERHADSRSAGSRARAGLAVLAAIEGGTVGLHAHDLTFFRPRLLIEASLRRGDFEAAGRLARLARQAGDPAAIVYEAAARIEGSDLDGAAALMAQAGDAAAAPGLAARVARVLGARAAGATLTVTDRRGVLAGFVDGEGAFEPEAGGTAAWVPPAALARARGRHTAGVRLSADSDLSAAALTALGPYRGTIVLLDVATGQVLAAVSDARTRAGGGTPALDQRREPASIQKIVTTAAALRAGRDPDAEISRMVCNGYQRYEGGTLWCSFAAGPLTGGLKQAMAVSCNVAFANLAVAVGWKGMVDELRRWGFDHPRDEWPGAGRVLKTEGTDRELASLGIGLDWTEASPAHAALFGAVVASGTMPAAGLVWADDGALGLWPRPLPVPPARAVLEPGWVPVMQRALAGVIEEGGTAEGMMPSSFPVVMKTGTASAPGLGYHVNYIGAGPMPHPAIAFSVRITHQPSSPRVRVAAQQVLSTLLQELGRRAPARILPGENVP